jgi:crotonobetainyl-CoA:carnitine CoA-transferase CaiB-like acyl-CoA transferase
MSAQNGLLIAGLFCRSREPASAVSRGDIMSNVNPHFQNLSLDPAEMIAVSEAYDLACRTLQNIGQLEVDREIIARGILRAVKTGERDTNKLCERAIHGLTAFDYRQHDA